MRAALWAGPLALARALHAGLLLPLVVCTALAMALLPGTFDPVPFRGGVIVARWTLLVAVPACCSPSCCSHPTA